MNITITLCQEEIVEALKDFVAKHDVVTKDKEIEINLVAGRGPAGHSAVITVAGNIVAEPPSRIVAPPVEPEVPAAVTTGVLVNAPEPPAEDTLFAADPAEEPVKKPRAKKEKPETPAEEEVPVPPVVVAAVDKQVDDLFAEENNVVEEVVDPGSEDESLFN